MTDSEMAIELLHEVFRPGHWAQPRYSIPTMKSRCVMCGKCGEMDGWADGTEYHWHQDCFNNATGEFEVMDGVNTDSAPPLRRLDVIRRLVQCGYWAKPVNLIDVIG